MDIGKNKKWLRKAAYTPVAVAVLAGAVCAGAGIGSAATADPGTTPDALQSSGIATAWSMENRTDQSIYGQWDAWNSKRETSRVATTADNPWQPGAIAKSFQEAASSWSGRICYNKQYWDFYPQQLSLADEGKFRLEVDSNKVPHVYYTTSYILPLSERMTGVRTDHNDTLKATGVRC
ncbi:hypothetical protein [Rhodococcus jostii]|uniref:hypothetical protein n=1 Tax=Rhodococcus jostii TaxID=132919 RepID=UPI003645EA04